MKKVVLLSLISIAMLSCKTQLVERSIKFNITSTSDYCGGANPPEELIADLQNPKPFTGTLYIHKDNGRVDEGVALDFKEGKSTQVDSCKRRSNTSRH